MIKGNMKKWVIGLGALLCAAVVLTGVYLKTQERISDGSEYSELYTWEEYLALSPEEQDAFFATFDSVERFEAWLEAVRPTETTDPEPVWDKTDKNPDAYTWEEYQALTSREQEAFFRWFGSVAAFEIWMEQAKPTESTEAALSWDESGKNPDAYKWEEYQALTPQQQEAFYLWFASEAAFESWMERAKPAESTEAALSWDESGKNPDAYTWEEYQALTAQEQEAFYLWFASEAAFESWMEQAKPTESTQAALSWDKSGKTPDAYTWEEYLALTPQEQDAFFLWFGSVEAFEAWMDTAISE